MRILASILHTPRVEIKTREFQWFWSNQRSRNPSFKKGPFTICGRNRSPNCEIEKESFLLPGKEAAVSWREGYWAEETVFQGEALFWSPSPTQPIHQHGFSVLLKEWKSFWIYMDPIRNEVRSSNKNPQLSQTLVYEKQRNPKRRPNQTS